MTPHQKLKHLLLVRSDLHSIDGQSVAITEDNIEDIYYSVFNKDALQDELCTLRGGDVETGIDCPLSRSYEAKGVAVQTPDGSWVGWTYWYGGGKHSEPEAIDWMNKAYNLSCTEEQKLVTIQTFTKEE